MSNQMTVKAEVTVQVLADGGYTINGVALAPGGVSPEGQPMAQPTDRLFRARENMTDVIEDMRTFLVKTSPFAVVSS